MPKTATVPPNYLFARPGCTLCLGGLLLFAWLWLPGTATAQAPRRCQVEQYDSLLRAQHPNYARGRDLLNRLVLESKSSVRSNASEEEEKIIIPVVVHVVHNTASNIIGGATNVNISDAQIRSQIDVLNEDYQRKEGTPGFNTSPVGANVNIEFWLASRTPQGGPTNGITRHYTTRKSYSTNEMDLLAEVAYWPSNRYLNIWVTDITGEFIGYAQFPDMTGMPGLAPENGLERTDGVIIDFTTFGRNIGTTTNGVYTQGRTTTHEVGHWLGLLHTWGDILCDESPDCLCGDDFINDTPAASEPYDELDCPTGNDNIFSSCTGVRTRNMIENYMDYSPDKCMNIFTGGQKERIRRVLQLSPRRKALVEAARQIFPESENLTVKIYNNPPEPGERNVNLEVLLRGSQPLQVSVYTTTGRLVSEQQFNSTPSTLVTVFLPSVKAGVYLIRVSTPDETQVKRLLLLD